MPALFLSFFCNQMPHKCAGTIQTSNVFM